MDVSSPAGCPLQLNSTSTDAAPLNDTPKYPFGCSHPSRLPCAKPDQSNETPGLLEEGILPTLRDARARLLSPGYVSIPHSAEVWAFCCESSEFHNMSRLLPQAAKPSGEAFLPPSSEKWERCPGTASPASVRASFRPLSPSVNIFDFNFSSHGDPLPDPAGRKHGVRFPIDGGGDGTVHAVVCWWRCFMDRDRTITISTSPLPPPKEPLDQDARPNRNAPPERQPAPAAATTPCRDHWRQSVYLLSRPVKVREGDVVRALAHHDDTTVWFHAVEREAQSVGCGQGAAAAAASSCGGAPAMAATAADAATAASQRPASKGPAPAAPVERVRPAREAEGATAPARRKPGVEEANVLTKRGVVALEPEDGPVIVAVPPVCVCGLHRTCPASRIWMLNDQSRAASFRSVIRSIVAGDAAGHHLARGPEKQQQKVDAATTATAAAAVVAEIKRRRNAPVPPACVVACISDGFLLPLLAAQEGASEVLEIQPSAAYGAVCRDVYHANGVDVDIDGNGDGNHQKRRVIRPFPGGISSVYELLMPSPGAGPLDNDGFGSAGRKLDAVIGEPFFADLSTAAWPLEPLLLFWCARTALEAGGHFSPRTRVVPARARLLACPLACGLLFRARRTVGDVEGVDMSAVNHRLGIVGCAVKPQPRGPSNGGCCEDGGEGVEEGDRETRLRDVESVRLSEYGHELLGLPTVVLDMDLTQPLCDLRGGRKEIRCCGRQPQPSTAAAGAGAGATEPAPQQRAGQEASDDVVCHGVALWLDIWLDEEGLHRLSTGPEVPYWPQGVLFFEEGWLVPSYGRSFHLEAALEDGALSVGVS